MVSLFLISSLLLASVVSATVDIRYASSSARLYLESGDGEGGEITPTEIWNAIKEKYPIFYPVNDDMSQSDVVTGKWYLEDDLYIYNDVLLNLIGSTSGGDCDELYLRSDADKYINVRGHGGSLMVRDTLVTTYDASVGGPDENYEDGRSYLSCLSEMVIEGQPTDCSGAAKNDRGTCTMDIINSEIAYLGYAAAESWGISWKLRGLCSDLSNADITDVIAVYGNIVDSHIHHLYYGQYSYGHGGGLISGNVIHDNVQYSVDPHHRSVNMMIVDNEVYNSGNHGIIVSKQCHNATFANNLVYDNVGVGIFPHSQSDGAIIVNNTLINNADTGITLLEGSNAIVSGNFLSGNGYGIRVSVGSENNVFFDNTVEDSSNYAFYSYGGNDVPVGKDTTTIKTLVLSGNDFSGNEKGFKIADSEQIQFIGNSVDGSDSMRVEDSVDILVEDNILPEGFDIKISSACVDSELSESPCSGSYVAFDKSVYVSNVMLILGEEGVDVEPMDPTLEPTMAFTVSPTPVGTLDIVDTVSPTASPTSVGTWGTVSPSVSPIGIVGTSYPTGFVGTGSPMSEASGTTTPTSSPTNEFVGDDDFSRGNGVDGVSSGNVYAPIFSTVAIVGGMVLLFV